MSFRSDNEKLTRHVPERVNGSTVLAGERPCARLEWCSSATRVRQDDGTTVRTPASGPRAFCEADDRIIEAALRAFPSTWARLWPSLLEHVTAEILVRIPFGPSAPIRCDVDEVLRAMVDCALSWHERVAAVDGTLTPPGGDDEDEPDWRQRSLGRHAPVLMGQSSRRLAGRVSALTGLAPEPMVRPELVASMGCGTPVADPVLSWDERVAAVAGVPLADVRGLAAGGPCAPGGTVMVSAGGAEAGSEILRLDYLARAAMGEIEPAPVCLIGVPCRECQRQALQLAPPAQHDGDTQHYSICSWCRDVMEEPDYRAWVKSWAAYYRDRVTPAMAAAG